jgi:hypothetical protein
MVCIATSETHIKPHHYKDEMGIAENRTSLGKFRVQKPEHVPIQSLAAILWNQARKGNILFADYSSNLHFGLFGS